MKNSTQNDSDYTDVKISIFEDEELDLVQKEANLLSTLFNCFGEFSRNTSIHGFRHLGRPKQCTLERLWWVAVIGVCIYICFEFTIMTLKKREENPVFVSFRQTPMHLWDIPFPALTICPSIKLKPKKYNYTESVKKFLSTNLTNDEIEQFMTTTMFCHEGFHRHWTPLFQHNPNRSAIEKYLKYAPSLNDILEFCLLGKARVPCDTLFSPTLTSSGLCFTFNMLDKSEMYHNKTFFHKNHGEHQRSLHWTLDNNYNKTLNSTYPIRITSVSDSLYFRLKISQSDIDETCEESKGFKIIVHHPADAPAVSHRYLLLSTGVNYKAWIKPDVITTSCSLKDYYPNKRGCFFANEKKLKFFKIYTQENCKLECISNLTLKKCGCVPHYIPYEESSRICGLGDIACVHQVKDEYLSMEMKLEVLDDDSSKQRMLQVCDCLPSCTSITYDTETSPEQASMSIENDTSYTTVYMTFKDSTFLTVERNELFSNADFWASCGGLFGLFTGLSVISLAEIVYFFTLKWMCDLWNLHKRVW